MCSSYKAAAIRKYLQSSFAPVTVQACRQYCVLVSLSAMTLNGLPWLYAQSCLEGPPGLSLETNG